jgi:cytochrome c oxidase cbb3-type subunit 4
MFASIHAWWTAALFVAFIGIIIWAFSSRRKEEFEEAARLPLDDVEDATDTSARMNGDAHG